MRKIYINYIQRPLLLIALVVMAVPFSLLASMLPVSAATSTYDSLDIVNKIKAYEYYQVFKKCVTRDDIADTDIAGYKYFDVSYGKTSSVNVGYVTAPKGTVDCDSSNTKAALIEALALFNMADSNPGEVLCNLGYKQTDAKSSGSKTSCADANTRIGTKDNFNAKNSASVIVATIKSKVFGGVEPVPSKAMMYYSTFSDFVTGCSAVVGTGAYSNSKVGIINSITTNGTITTNQSYVYTGSSISGATLLDIKPLTGSGTYGSYDNCDALVIGFSGDVFQDYVKAYQAYIYQAACGDKYTDAADAAACVNGSKNNTDITYCTVNYKDIAASYSTTLNPAQDNKSKRMACYVGQGNGGAEGCIVTGTTPLKACIDGAQHSSDATYCAVTYPEPDVPNKPDTNKAARAACTLGQGMPADAGLALKVPSASCSSNQNAPGCSGSSASTCGSIVSNIGWIICPVINAMGGMNDMMWGVASTLLTVNPITAKDAAYTIWSAFQSLANILLIVVFLIIIFSQLTSVGITNYGVKKMLPRLIIVAILINISFYIIQIAVDLSNILGSSLYSLLSGLADSSRAVPTWGALINLLTGFGAGALAITAGVTLVGGVQAALLMLLPMAAMSLLGFLAAMVTLIFRQAVIPILAVLAPLALVAYLLPNTEQWFKKWRGLFLSMLMLYPTAALLFGGVKLSAIMIVGDGGDWWKMMIGLIMLGVPLFMLPFIARQGGPLLSKLGGSLNGLAGKLGKPVADFAKPRQEVAKNKYLSAADSRNPFKKMALIGGRRNKLNQLKSSAYQAQQNAGFNKDLRDNAKKYADSMPEDSVAKSFMEGAVARAEAEELKSEMAPLTSEIASERATKPNFDLDGFLRTRALDGKKTEMQRVAAIHYAASLGRDNIMRELLNSSTPGVDEEVKRHAQEAISANAGSLVGKAPDLVKPAGVAFNTVTGSDMAKFSTYTMTAYMKHLEGLEKLASSPGATAKATKDFTDATNSFNSAVVDITNSPALQADFNGAGGKVIVDAVSSIGGTLSTKLASGISRIQSDGKIRP